MNTQHLQYIIEIERTRSISQAAENLFLGQPNLSRILRDMEESAGFAIFERTSKGVRPTERGALFLQHARSILREVESIDALGPRHPVPNRLRVCIPRSVTVFEAVAEYLSQLPPQQSLRAIIRECHARQALQWLVNGEAELALIRFRSEYRDYFAEQSAANGLELQILSRFRYQLLMHRSHPLARKPSLTARIWRASRRSSIPTFRAPAEKTRSRPSARSTPSTAWRSSRFWKRSPEATSGPRLCRSAFSRVGI